MYPYVPRQTEALGSHQGVTLHYDRQDPNFLRQNVLGNFFLLYSFGLFNQQGSAIIFFCFYVFVEQFLGHTPKKGPCPLKNGVNVF
jgi:hypothetical protein